MFCVFVLSVLVPKMLTFGFWVLWASERNSTPPSQPQPPPTPHPLIPAQDSPLREIPLSSLQKRSSPLSLSHASLAHGLDSARRLDALEWLVPLGCKPSSQPSLRGNGGKGGEIVLEGQNLVLKGGGPKGLAVFEGGGVGGNLGPKGLAGGEN